MGVNSLTKTVTRQRRSCDLNPGPSAPESSTLTTRLSSHYTRCSQHYSQRGGRCLPAVYKLGVSRKVSAAMRPLATCGGVLHSRRVSRRGRVGYRATVARLTDVNNCRTVVLPQWRR